MFRSRAELVIGRRVAWSLRRDGGRLAGFRRRQTTPTSRGAILGFFRSLAMAYARAAEARRFWPGTRMDARCGGVSVARRRLGRSGDMSELTRGAARPSSSACAQPAGADDSENLSAFFPPSGFMLGGGEIFPRPRLVKGRQDPAVPIGLAHRSVAPRSSLEDGDGLIAPFLTLSFPSRDFPFTDPFALPPPLASSSLSWFQGA